MPGFKVQSVEEFLREASEHSEGHEEAVTLPVERYQLSRLTITHDAILDWLIANPGKGAMSKCANYFGYTQAWLSSIVWSDAFQAKLRDKKEILFTETLVPLREQVAGVATRALERLGEKVEVIEDPKVLVDVADKMLHRLGYAPKADTAPTGTVNNTQNNFYEVTPELLAEARNSSKKGVDYAVDALPAPQGVQTVGEDNLGEVVSGGPSLCDGETSHAETRSEVAGDQV